MRILPFLYHLLSEHNSLPFTPMPKARAPFALELSKEPPSPSFDDNGNPSGSLARNLTKFTLQFCESSVDDPQFAALTEFFVIELPRTVAENSSLFLGNQSNSPLHDALTGVWNALMSFRAEALEPAACRFTIILSCLANALGEAPFLIVTEEIPRMLDWAWNLSSRWQIEEMDVDAFWIG
jgi:hypothetical protein